LFTVLARVKKKEDLAGVREEILATLRGFRETPIPAARLEGVKNHLRYRFALGLDNSEAIAATLAAYVGLRRTPETINKVYALYEQVSPEDIRRVAAKYFTDDSRTIVTLIGGASK
jgi:zinc protease